MSSERPELDRVLSCSTLPTLPSVGLQVLQLTRNPNVNAEQLAKVIETDPALSAKVLKTVNSSLYSLKDPCTTIRRALGYLGLAAVKSLVLGFSLMDSAKSVGGAPGMDEFSPLGPTRVMEVRGAETREWTVEPSAYGFGPFAPEALAGGTPAENARIVRDVLGGAGNSASTAAVILNAAAALLVGGVVEDFGDGVELARRGIREGAGLAALERLKLAYAQGAP